MESKEQTFTSFVTELSCFSFLCSNDSDVTQRLKYTNKILLPESVLYSLHQNEENNELEFLIIKRAVIAFYIFYYS